MDPSVVERRAAIRALISKLRDEAVEADKPVPCYSTLYHRARCTLEPAYLQRTLEVGRAYMAKRYQDEEFRKSHNAKVLAINNERWRRDEEYREKLRAWQRDKTARKRQAKLGHELLEIQEKVEELMRTTSEYSEIPDALTAMASLSSKVRKGDQAPK